MFTSTMWDWKPFCDVLGNPGQLTRSSPGKARALCFMGMSHFQDSEPVSMCVPYVSYCKSKLCWTFWLELCGRLSMVLLFFRLVCRLDEFVFLLFFRATGFSLHVLLGSGSSRSLRRVWECHFHVYEQPSKIYNILCTAIYRSNGDDIGHTCQIPLGYIYILYGLGQARFAFMTWTDSETEEF